MPPSKVTIPQQASMVPLAAVLAVGADIIRPNAGRYKRADNIRPYGFCADRDCIRRRWFPMEASGDASLRQGRSVTRGRVRCHLER